MWNMENRILSHLQPLFVYGREYFHNVWVTGKKEENVLFQNCNSEFVDTYANILTMVISENLALKPMKALLAN